MKLDVGCGANKLESAVGVDLWKSKGVDVVADGVHLPFRESTFTLVYSRRAIQHIKQDGVALNEIFRVLKSKCKAVVVVASVYGWVFYQLGLSESSSHYRTFHLYTESTIRRLLSKSEFKSWLIEKVKSTRKVGYDYRVTLKKKG